MPARFPILLVATLGCLVAVALAGVLWGTAQISWADRLAILMRDETAPRGLSLIVWQWRIPRVLGVGLIGAGLALIGDLIGVATQNPEATAPMMLVPQLTLGLASVGLQPVERFPEWIQGFVRNQPLSQWVYGMQALAGDTTDAAPQATLSVLGPGVAWAVGVIVVAGLLHALVSRRRR